ncbi:M23 family metallopeptidase [Bacillus suaedae]|uniref:M23 family metallopeptidase n=1 Tax=Halalkalibacter suaedae TaxID=2822140 RepID=A0A940X0S7_9BACI|nr:M23 family metallopeptidase [Bacillus suaedae]MBP3953196.1 M23 family metallopeptidase [Bacillus suaedae]
MREDNNRSSKTEEKQANIQSILRKRWAVPALYLVVAAFVLSAVFMLQDGDEVATPETGTTETGPIAGTDMDPFGQEAVPVNASSEQVQMPVADEEDINVVGYFYDMNGTDEEQQEALVYYNNEYIPNKGMDFAQVDGESFDVAASLSGTVIRAEKDELLGYVVEIQHENDVLTHYHSLESIEVEEGANVKQGDILGAAGRNVYNKEAGIHVHFEIRQDGVEVNPNSVFDQPIDSVKDIADEAKKEADKKEEEAPAEDETPAEEEAPADEEAPIEEEETNVEESPIEEEEETNEQAPAESDEDPADTEDELG